MLRDGNYTEDWVMYTVLESLYWIPETYNIVCQLLKNKKQKKNC